MTDTSKKDKDSRVPYEPPKLFDLGGGVAYAQETVCNFGGTPGVVACMPGNYALGGRCRSGGQAAGQCKTGGTALYRCKTGGVITI